MDLRQYLQAIRKFWWVILIPAVLGGLLGVYSVSREVPTYKGSVTFFVGIGGESGNANNQFAADQFAQRRVNSYVALLSTDRLGKMIVDSTDLGLSPKQVAGMITATGDINTVLLTANVTSSSEEVASEVADAVETQFIALVNEVENTGGTSSVTLQVVAGPTVVELPNSPIRSVGLRVVIGLVFGFALALVLELRDTSVRTEAQLDAQGAGPPVGRIPFDRRAREAPLVVQDDTHSIRAEAYRQLRTNLQFIDVERPIQVLIVTSAVAEEGKSSTSANLALAMVAAARRVLLIEADFRRPKLADYFGLERAVGLTDVLAGRVDIEDVLQPWGTEGLVVLPSGQIPPNPSELLGSEAMVLLLERFRSEYDMVIIDTPPLLPVTDAAVAATRADGVILVVRYGKTTRHQVALSVRSLTSVGARVLGSVMTMVPSGKGSEYASYRYEADNPTPISAKSDGARRPPPNEWPDEPSARLGSAKSTRS